MSKNLIGAILGLVLVGGFGTYIYLINSNKLVVGYNKGYEPDQPIPYSHKLHAGDLKMDCKYCHVGVETTRHALVPSLNICMNCHMSVKTDSPHIQKLFEAYGEGRSIFWNKVNLLPDHVKFDHAAHIRKGKSCKTCHGEVKTMTTVRQVESLSMGWCVDCHRKPENNAPTNCATCHY